MAQPCSGILTGLTNPATIKPLIMV